MILETDTPVNNRSRGTALSVGSAVLFGTSGPLASAIMATGWTPVEVTNARVVAAVVLLLPVVALVRPAALRLRAKDFPLVFGLGLLGVAGTQLFFFVAVSRIPVSLAMLLEYVAPVLVALWVRVFRKTRLRPMVWLGIGLAMVGLCMIAQVWQGLRLDPLGFAAGLGSAVCTAGFYLLGERGAEKHDPIGLATLSLLVGAILISLIRPPWALPSHLLGTRTDIGGAHPPVWLLIVLLAVFSTVLAYLAGTVSLKSVSSALASVLGLIEPLVAAILAWLLLGQVLDLSQLVGGAVLLAGAVLVQLTSRTVVGPEPLIERSKTNTDRPA
ncbi:MAG TPA: EamA family transporter [Pseudonocardiaceae bacterium]|nr:EamA family transporter [Pseudonocardiaceae bacterium]